MAFEFHKDKKTYITYQRENAENYVIPFIEKDLKITSDLRVMEIGCAEGGVLEAFAKIGCQCVGVELVKNRYEKAKEHLSTYIEQGTVQLSNKNIYDVNIAEEYNEPFDLIVLKDVIEHIHDQNQVLDHLRSFLKPGGHIFFGFPPWQMPFGGHQQIATSKFLSRLPYYHLLPYSLYRGILKLFGEPQKTIDDLIEIKETGISIERFQKIVKRNNYSVRLVTFFLFNPIYIYKFGIKPKKQNSLVSAIPYIRNYLTTCMYYLVRKEN